MQILVARKKEISDGYMAYLLTQETRAIEQNLSHRFFPVFLFSISTWTHCVSVQRQTSLALTSRPYIRRLFIFFLPPRFVYISVSPNLVSWLSYSVSMWSFGQHVCLFSPAITHLSNFWCVRNLPADLQNHPVLLKIYASLLIANNKSILNIKIRRHPK